MRKVELLSGRSDTRKFYQSVKRQREGYAPPTTFCNDVSGNLLVNDEDVLERWRENFGEPLSNNTNEASTPHQRHLDEPIPLEQAEEIPPPSLAEIKAAIGKLKRNTSPSPFSFSPYARCLKKHENSKLIHTTCSSILSRLMIALLVMSYTL